MSNNTYFLDQPVRVTDLNYGKHLGMTQLNGMAHNARYCFLAAHGLSETDIGGAGIMLAETKMKLKAECFQGDILRFFVSIEILSRAQFKCEISVVNAQTNTPVAMIEDLIVCYDYSRKRPASIPDSFKALFEVKNESVESATN